MNATIEDARQALDDYLRVTRDWTSNNDDPSRPRRSVFQPNQVNPYAYPPETIQTDLIVFSTIFTHLWSALADEKTFGLLYENRKPAFCELERIVTYCDDPSRLPGQCGFWYQKAVDFKPCSPEDNSGMRKLCRTLRNGFSHFNFRLSDWEPVDYFARLGLRLPPVVVEPNRKHNYRVFICDWGERTRDPADSKKKRASFGEPNTDSRLIGTHFGPLRYHLFLFLTRFFSEPGREPYTDIVTGATVV